MSHSNKHEPLPALPGQDDFAPVECVTGSTDAPVLFLCDHASNALPPRYGTLGLPPEQLDRHIGWDIGAADVTRALAARFNAPALLTRFSRLLIDPNRGADDPTLVMRLSDGAIIPGNLTADRQEIDHRRAAYWQPYRDAVRSTIDGMMARNIIPAIISIHSFTDVWRGNKRPWQIGLLWDSDWRLPMRLYQALQRDAGLQTGDNEPYDGALTGDTLYEHGTLRGLPHVLIEVRQDLIATPATAHVWAERIAGPLAEALDADGMDKVHYFTSRAGRGNRPRLADRETGTGQHPIPVRLKA